MILSLGLVNLLELTEFRDCAFTKDADEHMYKFRMEPPCPRYT